MPSVRGAGKSAAETQQVEHGEEIFGSPEILSGRGACPVSVPADFSHRTGKKQLFSELGAYSGSDRDALTTVL